MTSEEWNRLSDLFHAAREKSGRERVMLLDAACGESTSLRKAVEELLRKDEAPSGFLSEPLFSAFRGEARASAIHAGQSFGRYITVAPIGRGGMGEVWSARDSDLERLVALKFLNSEIIAGLDAQQITREAKAASALNHPGIVTIYELAQCGSTPALVMELVEGKPLRESCGKPMPILQVLNIGQLIAEALAAAHTMGTVHGDIKPENIILRPDGYIKLLDFGLARRIYAETIAGTGRPALGTLRYMSPEQARGQPLSPPSDLFSLGLVLYELVAGRHAFPAISAIETARRILEQEVVPLSSLNLQVPAPLDLLIGKMLVKEPCARPTAAEVGQTIRQLQASRRTFQGTIPAFWKWGAAALLIAVVCFAGWRWKVHVAGSDTTFRQITTLVPENQATAAAISPDGTVAAYANVDGIFLRTIADGHTRTVPSPDDFLVDRLAWFPDATKLLASGFFPATNAPAVWLISTAGAKPSLMRTQAREATPSPDGATVAFMSRDSSQIWVMDTHGNAARRIAAALGEGGFSSLLWSPDGRRLAYQRRRYYPGGFSDSFESVDLATGKIVDTAQNLAMRSAAALPDGRVMFLRWDDGDVISSHELWEVQTSLTTGAFRGAPRKIGTFAGGKTTSLVDLSVSANGRRAMALTQSSESSVFVGKFDQTTPSIREIRRLTLDDQRNFPHAWTADSSAVIFESDRSGSFDLFKQKVDHRTPETIVATPMVEILPQLAPDGHFVLYAAEPAETEQPWYYKPGTFTLMRVPVDGGTPEEVPIGGPLDEFRCALRAGARCVLRTTQNGQSRTYYDLDAVHGRGRVLARSQWSREVLGDWDISPDGKRVAIPNHDSQNARIRVVNLEEEPGQPAEREVVLLGVTDLQGLVWAPDGGGWFVSVNTSLGNRMLYVKEDGQFSSLGDIEGWAVPSPDGHWVAFSNPVNAKNAWLIENH